MSLAYVIALDAMHLPGGGAASFAAALAWLAATLIVIARGSTALCPRCRREFFLKRYQALVWPRWWTSRCQNCQIQIGEDGGSGPLATAAQHGSSEAG